MFSILSDANNRPEVEIDFHEPETVITLHWYEICVKFQRWNPCFRVAKSNGLIADTVRHWQLTGNGILPFCRPEVVITRQWNEIYVKFQRWNPCFRGRRIQWSYFWYCPALITNRKLKVAFSRPEVVVTMQWNKICVKFQRWNPYFRGRRIQWSHCRYCPTLASNRKWNLTIY